MTHNKSAEGVFTRRDGEHTYFIEAVCLFGPICILMISALVYALIPNSWLEVDALIALGDWGRSVWPKLDYDAEMLDVSGRGMAFTLYVLYCAGVLILHFSLMLPITWWAIGKSSERLTYPQTSAFWAIPLALLILVFWNVFERGFFGSSTSASRALTGGSVLWFWTALVWGGLAMFLGGAIVVIAKLWTHGRPEDRDEYERRISRESE
jgi:hypothetical protein